MNPYGELTKCERRCLSQQLQMGDILFSLLDSKDWGGGVGRASGELSTGSNKNLAGRATSAWELCPGLLS